MLNISRLYSGGVITNYFCPSKCKHCLYNCGPKRAKNYIDYHQALKILHTIRTLDCGSIHVGGGEPLINFDGMTTFLRAAIETNIAIEYIETNSAWVRNEDETMTRLEELMDLGVGMLLLSISPFHNEYIPLTKVKMLMNCCRRAGMDVFPWISDFYPDLDQLDDSAPHRLEELEQVLGPGYLQSLPRRYSLTMRGRALETFRDQFPLIPVKELLANSGPCLELANSSHFHIDLYGNYVPGLCTGFSIEIDDLGKPLAPEKYPILTMLHTGGINQLCKFAQEQFDFIPAEQYISKCDLCIAVRQHLVGKCGVKTPELQPEEYYK